MQNNWSLFLHLVVEADEIEEVAKFLEETAARLRGGEHQDSGSYCAGVIRWHLAELDHKTGKWFSYPLESGLKLDKELIGLLRDAALPGSKMQHLEEADFIHLRLDPNLTKVYSLGRDIKPPYRRQFMVVQSVSPKEPNVAGSFPMREFSPMENDIESGVLNKDNPPDTLTGEELPTFLSDRSG